jgi:hypothetical protein
MNLCSLCVENLAKQDLDVFQPIKYPESEV